MKIYKVTDKEFKEYGRILTGYEKNCQAIMKALSNSTPLPEGVGYVPTEPAVECLPETKELALSLFGGTPAEFGWCNGRNTKLNCLEYHRCSEFNLGTEDFVLMLAKQSEIEDGKLDTSLVKAFKVPRGVLVEIYATTLHYAPCHLDPEKGFRVLVALTEGTNTERPELSGHGADDDLLRAANKWLLAHPESTEAGEGAYVGLVGENLSL